MARRPGGPSGPWPKTPFLVTVFGGTGFLGRRIVRSLLDAGIRVRIAVRHSAAASTIADGDAAEVVQADIRDEASIAQAVSGAIGVVNAVGLYVETAAATFHGVHVRGARHVARQTWRAQVPRLIHISGIGVDNTSPSSYVRARASGEQCVREAFPGATILRPSVLFGAGDAFLNVLDAITRRTPVIPLFGTGATRLQPVYVEDVAKAAAKSLTEPRACGKTYELGGPQICTYRELIMTVLNHTGRRRLLLPLPFFVWSMLAKLASTLRSPPITGDQVILMRQDNVVASGALTFADLGITPCSMEALLNDCLGRGNAV